MGMCKVSGGISTVVGNRIKEVEGETPNSRKTLSDFSGKRIQVRWFGPDGRAIRDRDFTNHGNSKRHPVVPHDHPWDWNNDPARNEDWEYPDNDKFNADEIDC